MRFRFIRPVVLAAGSFLGLFAGGLVRAEDPVVFINEVRTQGSESIELYNSLPGPKDVSGWKIHEGQEGYEIPDGIIIPGDGYQTLSLPVILDDVGGEIALIDLQGEIQDALFYGQLGSAPLAPPSSLLAGAPPSIARAPDASQFQEVPLPDPLTDGLYWTVDFTSTFGQMNNARPPLLGTSVELNEIQLVPGSGDLIELYNSSNFTVNLTEWFITNGFAYVDLGGPISPNGFRVFQATGFDIEALGLLYLYDSEDIRRDQLGFHDGPLAPAPPSSGVCAGRFPDGAGPNLGFDWDSSGGGITFLLLDCSLGGRNGGTTGIPDDDRILLRSWGRLKEGYRLQTP